MSCHTEVWPIMATVDKVYPILINFRHVRLKRLRIGYSATLWQMLHNMASTGPVWSVVGNGGQLSSRISSLNELVHFNAKLRDLVLVYQVMEWKALLGRIGRIWSNMAYYSPVFVIVSRYDGLGSYFFLYYLFRAILALSVKFHHIKIKVPGNAKVARNGP